MKTIQELFIVSAFELELFEDDGEVLAEDITLPGPVEDDILRILEKEKINVVSLYSEHAEINFTDLALYVGIRVSDNSQMPLGNTYASSATIHLDKNGEVIKVET